jgi:hypothetical protein
MEGFDNELFGPASVIRAKNDNKAIALTILNLVWVLAC